ncbi:hypothetical protein SNEBB_004405 [Seison nebaliae]|nr:hypothetical protein SNEBB_004405 [Seison nebaliae]
MGEDVEMEKMEKFMEENEENTNEHFAEKGRYKKLKFLGEGQYAVVYKALDLIKTKEVAIKQLKVTDRSDWINGIDLTALREIKLLREIEHDHILNLIDVYVNRSKLINLVFEFMIGDLSHVIRDLSIPMTLSIIKSYMMMLLRGLEFIHANGLLHRDLKPNNLLISSEGNLRIGDFGLAKRFGTPNRQMTPQVITIWYRPPELIYGARFYGTGVDMWSVGCILAELLLRNPFLPGANELEQLSKIFNVFGTPNTDNWPNVKSLSGYIEPHPREPVPLNQIFTAASEDLLMLLSEMMMLNPAKRITTTEALKSPFFINRPPPCPSSELPLPKSLTEKLEDQSMSDKLTSKKNMSLKSRKKLNFHD